MESTAQSMTTSSGCFGPNSPCGKAEAKEVMSTFDSLWKGKKVSEADREKVSQFLLSHIGDESFHDVVRSAKTRPVAQEWLFNWSLPTRRMDQLDAALAKWPRIDELCAPLQQLDDIMISFPGKRIIEHIDSFQEQVLALCGDDDLLKSEIRGLVDRSRPIELPEGISAEQGDTLQGMLNNTGEELLRRKVQEAVSRKVSANVQDYVLGVLAQADEGLLTFDEFSALYWWGGSDAKIVEPRNGEAFLNPKPEFRVVKNKRYLARQIHQTLALAYLRQARDYYRAGDVFFRNVDERDAFHSVSGRCVLALQRPFVGSYDHAGMMGENDVGTPAPYELFSGRNATLRSQWEYHRIFNRFFRIDASKLLDDEGLKLAKAYWKENWQAKIQEAYHQATLKVQQGLDSREQGPQYQTRCGANSRKGFVGKVVPLGSLRVCPTPFERIHEEVTQPVDEERPEKDALCSEFVAKVMVAAVIEFAKQLEEEIPFFEAKLVHQPFRRHRNISTLLPNRLMDDLVEDGIAMPLPGPGPFANLIKH